MRGSALRACVMAAAAALAGCATSIDGSCERRAATADGYADDIAHNVLHYDNLVRECRGMAARPIPEDEPRLAGQ